MPHRQLPVRNLPGACAALAMLICCAGAQADVYRIEAAGGVTVFTNAPTQQEKNVIRRDALKPVLLQARPARVEPAPRGRASSFVPAYHRTQYADHIQAAARANNVETALIRAVISAESGYDPSARSPAGAAGLMQLMPETARRYGVTNRFDPAQSIRAGTRYLGDLLAMFNGDAQLAVAAFNAGEKAVIRYGNRIPPYPETAAYVPRVMRYYRTYRAAS